MCDPPRRVTRVERNETFQEGRLRRHAGSQQSGNYAPGIAWVTCGKGGKTVLERWWLGRAPPCQSRKQPFHLEVTGKVQRSTTLKTNNCRTLSQRRSFMRRLELGQTLNKSH